MAKKKQPPLPVVPVPVLAPDHESLVSEWHDLELNMVLAETPRWMRLDLQFDRTAYPYLAKKLVNKPLTDIMQMLCTIFLMNCNEFEAVPPSTLENTAKEDVIQQGTLSILRQRRQNLSDWLDAVKSRIAELEAEEADQGQEVPENPSQDAPAARAPYPAAELSPSKPLPVAQEEETKQTEPEPEPAMPVAAESVQIAPSVPSIPRSPSTENPAPVQTGTAEEKPLSGREKLRRALKNDPKARAMLYGDENNDEDDANYPPSATDKHPVVSTSSDTGVPVSGVPSKHPESTDADR